MAVETLVSVLMPAYNCASFIGAAIDSVLAQTYTHFELLVINDGSTDETPEIVADYCKHDPRVQIYFHAHEGIAASRNQALRLARGRFLAWLDADDLAYPNRLEQQVNALELFPDRVMIGSAYQTIDERGVDSAVNRMPETDTLIRWQCLFHSPFAQSTVMLRNEAVRANQLSYDPAMPPAEDFDLWSRVLQYGQGRNLPEPLVCYRQHPHQASRMDQLQLCENAGRVAQRNLTALGVPLPIEQVQCLREWYYRFPNRFRSADLPLAMVFFDILNRFTSQPGLDVDDLQRLRGRWLGRLLRAGGRSGEVSWTLNLLRQFTAQDLRAIIAYLRVRDGQ